MEGESRKCSECNFAILDDYGYSNYTVEGTTVHCSKGLNPNGCFDRWYGEDERDTFAAGCKKFRNNIGPVRVDCDREDAARTDDWGSETFYLPYATKQVSAKKISKILG